ncbi:Holliday junction resolvase RuvX [Lysobacter korlensis]|uniref:Putative pre-16S rRNA nuclease n=1 Tax=Lysobacter korlensis TaxID=553636 RepID=A0ABV6RM19_9GAMM
MRLGVDVGKVRVGIARSDPAGMLATPVATLARAGELDSGFRALVDEHQPVEVVVGLPLSMSGGETASTADAREVAARLARVAGVPVRLVDERLSTVGAQRSLQAAGRNSKQSRSVIDQAAAVIILQHALDFERTADRPPGVVVGSVPDDAEEGHPHG